MPTSGPTQRVSRDTRRLLAAAGLALLSLWALARLRFPDSPVAASPVPPLLAQLTPPTRFADLTAEVATAAADARKLLSIVPLAGHDGRRPRLALRVRPGVAAALVRAEGSPSLTVASEALATDRPSGLMLVASEDTSAVSTPRLADPSTLANGRYLVAASATADTMAIRPVFVPPLAASWSRAWRADAWPLPESSTLGPGAFLFSTTGELVGAVAADAAGGRAIVPAQPLYAAIDALMAAPPGQGRGWLGLTVATLTPALAAATGAPAGVIVTAVDAHSPAAHLVSPGEVIGSVDNAAVATAADWDVVSGRLREGDTLMLRLLGREGDRDVSITAAVAPDQEDVPLGLRLQRVEGGTLVTAVDRDSAGAAAGLQAGDVLTRVGRVHRPGPAQVTRAFAEATDAGVLVLFERSGTAGAAALER